MNHDSISEIKELLQSEGIALKKRFGQNFLVRTAFRENIREIISAGIPASATALERELWEIGPGLGALTDEIRSLGLPLRLFEIDRALIRILRRRFGEDFAIEEGDAVKLLPARLARVDVGPAAVVGNLPYFSATAIIAALVEASWVTANAVPFMTFLLQEELVGRLAAAPGTKNYAALTVLVQACYTVERGPAVPGSAFYPVPRVGSRVVSLYRRRDVAPVEILRIASVVTRRAFAQRRKTLRNTLGQFNDHMSQVGIDAGARPEQLAPEKFLDLARSLRESDVSL